MSPPSANGSASRWWPGRSRKASQSLAAYRRLALQLHHDLPREQSTRSVLMTTPTASGLCTRGCAALACCLAEELGRPVLLLDASTREAEVTRMLDCTSHVGFTDLLADGDLALDDLIVPTTERNVSFLPAGTGLGQPAQSAPHDCISDLLERAASRFDFVVLYGGSVLDDATALALAPSVGCVLLMAIEKKTTLEEVEAAESALSAGGARKLGLVLTTPLRGRSWAMKGAPRR
jgi:tyrosine-protein kinase Etk/Wzc